MSLETVAASDGATVMIAEGSIVVSFELVGKGLIGKRVSLLELGIIVEVEFRRVGTSEGKPVPFSSEFVGSDVEGSVPVLAGSKVMV